MVPVIGDQRASDSVLMVSGRFPMRVLLRRGDGGALITAIMGERREGAGSNIRRRLPDLRGGDDMGMRIAQHSRGRANSTTIDPANRYLKSRSAHTRAAIIARNRAAVRDGRS